MNKILTFLAIVAISTSLMSQEYHPGFQTKVAGEDLQYHSPQPDAKLALLVRSEDSARFIEWELGGPSKGLNPWRVLLLAGIDVNPDDPHAWKFLVNDQHLFTISSPLDTLDKVLEWTGPEGASLTFKVKEVDKYGDFMGYLFLNLPPSFAEPGTPVRIKVVGESAGSRTWFMVFQYATVDKVSLIAENAVEKTAEGNMQILRTTIVHYGGPLETEIFVGNKKFDRQIVFGHQALAIPVPEITRDTTIPVRITAGETVLCDTAFTLRPVPRRTIYLMHHSHNDIGYTHVQDEVEQMQWKNLADAVKVAEATRDFPEGARFRWNVEVMWAVVSYLEQATPEEKAAFMEAVRNGSIELHGLYANELTSLCESEELLQLMEPARRIARECGVELTSAMITDIPGWTWGLVPALSLSGVKYLSLGTNSGHRIGNTIKEWGDKPFYWVSPSGEERILCWVHRQGYAFFHTGLDYKKIKKRLQEDLIFEYMNALAAENYPYEEVMLRYTIGSDNGPVDDYLPELVRSWNEKYVTPQIRISTVGEAFSIFEKQHGSTLPEVKGDFTAFWEDGAYSTARETALNRASAARLNQAQILRSMFNDDYPPEEFRKAWKYILLYDEHTWGSWNSISEPESEFTLSQWAIKESYARKAHELSSRLYMESMPEVSPEDFPLQSFQVINTCSWARSGLVTLPVDILPAFAVIKDQDGQIQPTQALSDGQLAFLAKDIPALGAKIYFTEPGKKMFHLPDEGAPVPVLASQDFEIQVDEKTGAIQKLTWKDQGIDLADGSVWGGLNQYLYVDGRHPDNPQMVERTRMMTGEEGPVINSIRILSQPPGCRAMETEISLISGLDEVYITNTLDKKLVYTPEAVHFAFPFRIPGGVMRYDLAFAQCEVEKDQIKGSNRNYITMENWVDISNAQYGVTVACPDAPLFEVGRLTMDEIVTGWVENIEPSQTFFSYLMNNYWETNYAAGQEGMASFTYIIKPHGAFDALRAERFGMESRYPLAVIPSTKKPGTRNSEHGIRNTEPGMFSDAVLISLKPTGKPGESLACLFNPTDTEMEIDLNQKGMAFYRSGIDGDVTDKADVRSLTIPPQAIRFIVIVNK